MGDESILLSHRPAYRLHKTVLNAGISGISFYQDINDCIIYFCDCCVNIPGQRVSVRRSRCAVFAKKEPAQSTSPFRFVICKNKPTLPSVHTKTYRNGRWVPCPSFTLPSSACGRSRAGGLRSPCGPRAPVDWLVGLYMNTTNRTGQAGFALPRTAFTVRCHTVPRGVRRTLR